jgi:hypothetical protein
MRAPSSLPRWTRHFVYRSERLRTTWRFRVGLVALLLISMWLTEDWWSVAIERSLACEANGAPSDAILIENFANEYLLFERATMLQRTGLAGRVIVPVEADKNTLQPDPVALGTAKLMAEIARLEAMEIVPVLEVEPISLNAARDILRFVQSQRIRSVTVLSPNLRSRRSALVYEATLGRAGITILCDPVPTQRAWTLTWHGIQNVAEQWLKLQYYRLYVVPFLSAPSST